MRCFHRADAPWLGPIQPLARPIVPGQRAFAVSTRRRSKTIVGASRLSTAQKATTHAPWWSKPPRWGYGLLVGYGYFPLLAGAWLLAALLCACLITSTQKSSFLPGNPAALHSALAASSVAASSANQLGRAGARLETPAAS